MENTVQFTGSTKNPREWSCSGMLNEAELAKHEANYVKVACIDNEVIQIDVNTFRDLVRHNPDFAKEMIDILSSNSVQIFRRFFCLNHKQSFRRFADILICLSDRILKKTEFKLPLSRKELAELTGMSSETVIRALKKFRSDGILRINWKCIEVTDY